MLGKIPILEIHPTSRACSLEKKKKKKTCLIKTCLFCRGKVITENIYAVNNNNSNNNNRRMYPTTQPLSLCKQDTSVIL